MIQLHCLVCNGRYLQFADGQEKTMCYAGGVCLKCYKKLAGEKN